MSDKCLFFEDINSLEENLNMAKKLLNTNVIDNYFLSSLMKIVLISKI